MIFKKKKHFCHINISICQTPFPIIYRRENIKILIRNRFLCFAYGSPLPKPILSRIIHKNGLSLLTSAWSNEPGFQDVP